MNLNTIGRTYLFFLYSVIHFLSEWIARTRCKSKQNRQTFCLRFSYVTHSRLPTRHDLMIVIIMFDDDNDNNNNNSQKSYGVLAPIAPSLPAVHSPLHWTENCSFLQL